jgi:hypothetical protein
MDDREEKIRHRAYALWKAAGEPEGHDDDFWWQAEKEVQQEEAAPSGELDRDVADREETATRGHDGEEAAKPRVAADREIAHAGDKPREPD